MVDPPDIHRNQLTIAQRFVVVHIDPDWRPQRQCSVVVAAAVVAAAALVAAGTAAAVGMAVEGSILDAEDTSNIGVLLLWDTSEDTSAVAHY
jgi:hypothetical protein